MLLTTVVLVIPVRSLEIPPAPLNPIPAIGVFVLGPQVRGPLTVLK